MFFKGLLGPHCFAGFPSPSPRFCLGIPPGPACPAFPSGNIPEAFAISCYLPPLLCPPPCRAEEAHAASPPRRVTQTPSRQSHSCADLKSPTSAFLAPKCPHLLVIPCLWTLRAPAERPSLQMKMSQCVSQLLAECLPGALFLSAGAQGNGVLGFLLRGGGRNDSAPQMRSRAGKELSAALNRFHVWFVNRCNHTIIASLSSEVV